MTSFKEKSILAVLALVLVGGMVLHLLTPDLEISRAERRKLEQAPVLSWEALSSGTYATELEDYLLDQFPLRDGFRTLKALWTYYVLGQKDNNGVLLHNGSASRLDSTLDEGQLNYFVKKLQSLRREFFPDSQVWCAVVPDKNYSLTEGTDYPRMDYDALFSAVREGLPWATHVDLTGALAAGDYYRTDSHWRQERLEAVRETLAGAMGLTLSPWEDYEAATLADFYGVYYGQAALPMAAEELVYLENDVTRAAVVTGPELTGEQPVYAPERFSELDGYDVFLHGAQAVLTIENPLAETDRELIIFRDSFGSSLAPLLLDGYRTITLVDIRYVVSSYLDRFVDFHGQDVLLLYSTTVINTASILR